MRRLLTLTGFFGAMTCAGAATFTFTPTEDTQTQQDDATGNFSTLPTVSFGAPGGGQARSILFRFDVGSLASIAASDFVSVSLDLTLVDSTGDREGFVGTLSDANADWSVTEASWDNRTTGTPWDVAGGARSLMDSESILNPEFALTSDDSLNGTVISIPLTPGTGYADFAELFAEWNDGTNNGLVIYNQNPGNSGEQTFHSSEATDPAVRPRLVVETVPEPSSAILAALGGLFIFRRRR